MRVRAMCVFRDFVPDTGDESAPKNSDSARISTFGNNSETEDGIGASKAHRWKERVVNVGDEADDPEPPPRLLRRLRHLREYSGLLR